MDSGRDHILGNPTADITLLEFGSYDCPYCHAAHEVIAELRDRFGDRMRYVFRQRPITGSEAALEAAELAEYAGETTGRFWEVHDALMKRGPVFNPGDFAEIAAEFELPPAEARRDAKVNAANKVQADRLSAQRSGAQFTPTFFINNRRYEGAWDRSALSEAMLGSLGHRIQSATFDFVRWAPSAGLLLLLMSVAAILIENSPAGGGFAALWEVPFTMALGGSEIALPLRDWINHGLLTVFFLVVGLEIKREFTVGRLSTRRAAALPVAAALGGMTVPALIYLLVIPAGPLMPGWGMPIATDTAFAVALLIMLGDRVPIELRVFLTAAVIVDDLVGIAVVALVLHARDPSRFSRGLRLRDGGDRRAQPHRRVSAAALRDPRHSPLVLPARGGHSRHAGRRDPCRADAHAPAGEPERADGAGRDDRACRSEKLGGSGPAPRPVAARAGSAGRDPRPDRVARRQAAAHDRAVVELLRAADLRARQRGRDPVAGRVCVARAADAGDHARAGGGQAARHHDRRRAGGASRASP